MPEISVIVPVYRVEPYLRRCVDSLLGQRFADFELLLVDDGSPDRCGAICEEYAARDSRVHALHRENGGLSAARNTGLDWVFAHSGSRWLAFVDSDDWVSPDYLLLLHRAAVQTGCPISVCGFFRTAGEPLPPAAEERPQVLCAEDYYCSETVHGGVTMVAWNKLYHRSLFETLRYPAGKLHEDEFTTYRAVYQAGRAAVLSAQLYAYFQNPAGIMGSPWSPRRMDVLEAVEQQIAFARKEGCPALEQKAVKQYVYTAYEQLEQARATPAGKSCRGLLRRKLARGLGMGRRCGAFPMGWDTLWAYEQAWPVKPLWWLLSKARRARGNGDE